MMLWISRLGAIPNVNMIRAKLLLRAEMATLPKNSYVRIVLIILLVMVRVTDLISIEIMIGSLLKLSVCSAVTLCACVDIVVHTAPSVVKIVLRFTTIVIMLVRKLTPWAMLLARFEQKVCLGLMLMPRCGLVVSVVPKVLIVDVLLRLISVTENVPWFYVARVACMLA